MTALVAVESAVLVLLTLLVAGLLRSHATILQRLHELDGSADANDGAPRAPQIRTVAGVPEPVSGRPLGAQAHDVAGDDGAGGSVVVRVTDVAHDTVLLFLSSGCQTCQAFWSALGDPAQIHLPRGTRLVVITKDLIDERPAELARLRPAGVDVLASSRAWVDYAVPGSPYVVSIDGTSGTVTGEGTGMSWEQVARLLAQATGDVAFVSGSALRDTKPVSDAEREARVDRALLDAGILPGDPSLYPPTPGEPPA